ncbi:hypothetical protein FPOAC2_06652 [Fusarium poae]
MPAQELGRFDRGFPKKKGKLASDAVATPPKPLPPTTLTEEWLQSLLPRRASPAAIIAPNSTPTAAGADAHDVCLNSSFRFEPPEVQRFPTLSDVTQRHQDGFRRLPRQRGTCGRRDMGALSPLAMLLSPAPLLPRLPTTHYASSAEASRLLGPKDSSFLSLYELLDTYCLPFWFLS